MKSSSLNPWFSCMHVYLVLGLFPPHGLYLGLLVYLTSVHIHETMYPLLVMDWCSSSEVSAHPGLLFLLVLPWLVTHRVLSLPRNFQCFLPRCWVWLREVCFGETFTWQVPTKATRRLIDSHFTFFSFWCLGCQAVLPFWNGTWRVSEPRDSQPGPIYYCYEV